MDELRDLLIINNRLTYLLGQIRSSKAVPEEYSELLELISAESYNDTVDQITAFIRSNTDTTANIPATDPEYREYLISEVIRVGRLIDLKVETDKQKTHIRFLKRNFLRYAAAIMILLSAGSYFLFVVNKKSAHEPVTKAIVKNDIAPGTNKAVLTLGNGTRIILDSAQNGSLAQQGNADIIKNDSGRLTYRHGGGKTNEIVFNMLSTPRGGKYQITLPDGSNVWLNAASSIRYPSTFAGNERKVIITGEAYFKVIHNPKQPFIVEVNGTEVRDLGTHFNINAYTDELSLKVTLIQGAVKVSTSVESKRLVPAEQASMEKGKIIVEKNVDTEKVIAWKNGWFELDNTPLDQLMRQVSRWYDIDVKYEEVIPPMTFGGRISNKLPLSKLLQSLETYGIGIKFRVEGKTLIIHS